MGSNQESLVKLGVRGKITGRRKAFPSIDSSEIFFLAPIAFLISCFSQPEDTYIGLVSAQPFGQESAFFLDSRVQIRFM